MTKENLVPEITEYQIPSSQLVIYENGTFFPVEFNPTQETEYETPGNIYPNNMHKKIINPEWDLSKWRKFVKDTSIFRDKKDILTILNKEQRKPIPAEELQLVDSVGLSPFSYDVFFTGKRPESPFFSAPDLDTRLREIYSQAEQVVGKQTPYFGIRIATQFEDEDVKRRWFQEKPGLDKVRHVTAYPTVNLYHRVLSFEKQFEALLEKAGFQTVLDKMDEMTGGKE